MKKAKMIGLHLIVFLVVFSISGCVWFTYHYEFNQAADNVASVDICRCIYDKEENLELEIICTLEQSQAKQLVKDIAALDSYKYFGDFSRDFYGIVVRITYKNGEGELLSSFLTADVDSSGKWVVRMDNFDQTDFNAVLLKYVDSTLVPELNNP